jgi:hypothetical protein
MNLFLWPHQIQGANPFNFRNYPHQWYVLKCFSSNLVTLICNHSHCVHTNDSSVLVYVSACSSIAGMQTYHGTDTMVSTLILGGKMLLLDVMFMLEPVVHVFYTSSAKGHNSPAIDAFFSQLVSTVSKRGNSCRLCDMLEYLMYLDKLVECKRGAHWFSEVDTHAEELGKFT